MSNIATRPETRGTFGVATSTRWIASAVGFGIPERGGNAFDAGVAVGLILPIVVPHLSGAGLSARRSNDRSYAVYVDEAEGR